MEETTVYYEVRSFFNSNSFNTEAEARASIESARNGYPENTHMKTESREYWKNVAGSMVVFKVTKTVCQI